MSETEAARGIRAGELPGDAEACAHLWVRALRHRDGEVDAAFMADMVLTALRRPVVRFAVAGDPIAGFALTDGGTEDSGTEDGGAEDATECTLHFLAVEPDAAGAGLGAALLADAIAHAGAQGFHSVLLDVRPVNTRAIRLYEHAGFVPEGSAVPLWRGGYPMHRYRLRLTAPQDSVRR